MARIAVQGAPGCFSEEAALGLDAGAAIVYCEDFDRLFAAATGGEADYALVPFENTLVGPILATQAGLADPRFEKLTVTRLRIVHCLLAPPGVGIADLREVLSHPVALAQCQRYLAAHPRLRPRPFFDTAGSVRDIMAHPPGGRAAIASPRAGDIYKAGVVASDIADRKDNFTRFVLIRKA